MPSTRNKRSGKAGGKATAAGQGSGSGSGPGKGGGPGAGPEGKHPQLLEPCPICLLPFKEPAITECGHIFCFGCLNELVNTSSTFPRCPLCRRNL